MRKYKLKNNNYTVEVEEFSDITELLKVCDSRTLNSWVSKSESARKNDDDGWCGDSYEGARNKLVYGWDEKIEDIKKEYKKITKSADVKRPTVFVSNVGYAPIVPNAIKGLPKSMLNIKKEYKKAKIIDLCVDLGVKALLDADTVIKRMVQVMGKVNSLEKNGFRVKLSFMKTFNNNNNDGNLTYCCKMVVKNEYQPMDLKRVSFPVGHPAMFRRIMFDWYERFPNAKYFSGYGYSLGVMYQNHKTKYDNLVKMLTKENQYIINYYTDLDELFSKLK